MQKKPYVCPRCNSKNNISYSNDFLSASGIFRNKRKCNDCGYIGPLFMIEDDNKSYEIDDGEELKISESDIKYILISGLLFLILLVILLI